ncbi:MAG: Secretion system C-terminal sorting domain [Bacteroidota bacterium]|jgi:hypothetical protein
MKQFILVAFLWSIASSPALGQYIHFNNVYQSDPIENPQPAFLFQHQNLYKIYGFNTDSNFNLTLNFWEIDPFGVPNNFIMFTPEQNVFVYNYSSLRQTGIMLPDSSIILLKGGRSVFCPITNEYLPSFSLCRVFEDSVIWNIEEPLHINNACDTSSEYKSFGLFLDADQNIVVFCNVLKPGLNSGFNQTRGHSLTYFSQEGELLEHFDFVQSEPEFDGYDVVKAIYPIGENYFAIANTRATGGGKHALMKLNHEGGIIDSLHFGNPDFSNNEGLNGDMHLTTMEDGNLLLLYSWCDYFYYWPNQNTQSRMYCAIVNPNTMEIIFNQPIASPVDDILTQGLVQIENSMHKSDGQNIFLYRYISLPDLLSHNTIWSINEDGQTNWIREYHSPNDGPEFIYLQETINGSMETADNGILCYGISDYLTEENMQLIDTWLLKLDACGYEEPSECPPVVSVGNGTAISSFNAWPNPFRNQLKAQLPVNAKRVDWLDATGRLVHSEMVYYPNQEWNLSAMPIGIYHMQVVLEDGRVLSKKVVKE